MARCAKLRCVLGFAIVCVVSAAAWVYLLAARGGYWLTGQRLPAAAHSTAAATAATTTTTTTAAAAGAGSDAGSRAWPSVVAVVPARNEADSLPVTLPTLLSQDYPGEFRVLLVDDGSDDGTGLVAAELGEKSAGDGGAPLTVVAGKPRPDGWAGKVWAMATGFEAVGDTPRYVLFTDADIAWGAAALRDLVQAAEADDRDLVSQMVLLRAQTAWERVIVPAFVYFFAKLYPFAAVNDPRSRTAAGAGGCMLIRRSALEAAGGLAPIRGALIDDVAFAALLKRNGSRIWLGLTTNIRSARPYPSLASLWHMIARSAYTQLRYNPALLTGTIVGLLLLYAVPPAGAITALIAAATGSAVGATGASTVVAGLAGLLGWALMTISYLPMLRFYRLSPLRAPALPLVALLYAAMTADSARRHYSGRAVSWRGRAAERV
jgi:hopene-associated glycosyltransferase HpnB